MSARYRFVIGRRKKYPESIELEVYVNRECRVYIATGVSCPPNMWDDKRQSIKARLPNSARMNAELRRLEQQVRDAEDTAERKGINFGKNEIRKAITGQDIAAITFMDLFISYYGDETTTKIALVTYSQYKTYVNIWNRLAKEIGIPLTIPDLTQEHVRAMSQKMLLTASVNAVNYRMAFLSRLVRLAIKDERLSTNPFATYQRGRATKSHRQALSPDNLVALETMDRETLTELEILSLDRFLFACYTGLRWYDSNPPRTAIIESPDGLIIDLVTHKEKVRATLPLRALFDGKPEALVQRYLKDYPNLTTLFPDRGYCAIQYDLIKFTKRLGLSKRITFHIARHTCATRLAEKTGDPYIIKQVLAHSGIEIGLRYVHESAETLRKKLNSIKW